MKQILPLIFLVILTACTSGSEERPAGWDGAWKATWETDPASFEGIDGITDFTMTGQFTFDNDELNIKAFGFEGCVFSQDTLDHSLSWKVSNDSLITKNDEETPGMVFLIKDKTEDRIRLQLMEDIFLTLEKK